MAIVPSSTTLADLSSIVLGYVTTNAGDIFTKSNINMWSKYKPIKLNKTGKLTEDDWYNNSYGIEDNKEYTITDSKDIEQAFADVKNGIYSWTYERPRGVDYGEWFRVWDWVGYNTDAVCPFYFENASRSDNAIVRVGMYQNLPTNNITAADLGRILSNDFDLGNVSYGILYQKNGGSNIYFECENTSQNGKGKYPVYDSNGNIASYSINIGGAGTYVVVPVIAAWNRGWFATLPFSPLSFTVSTSTVTPLTINANISKGSKYTINSISITAGNGGANAGTLYVLFYKSQPGIGEDISPDTAREYVEFSYSSISAGATQMVVQNEKLEIYPDDYPIVYVKTTDTKANKDVVKQVY